MAIDTATGTDQPITYEVLVIFMLVSVCVRLADREAMVPLSLESTLSRAKH